MKKLIALVIALVLMLSCTACGTTSEEKYKEPANKISSLLSDTIENNISNIEDTNDFISDVTSIIKEELNNQQNSTDIAIEENTTDKNEISNKENVANKEESSNVFFNDSNLGFTYNSLTVNPRYVYWQDGKLYAECFLINGYSTTAHTISFPELKFSNDDGVIASGSFGVLQDIMIQPYTYYIHTFIFSGDAVKNYGADLSHLFTSASFDLYN